MDKLKDKQELKAATSDKKLRCFFLFTAICNLILLVAILADLHDRVDPNGRLIDWFIIVISGLSFSLNIGGWLGLMIKARRRGFRRPDPVEE